MVGGPASIQSTAVHRPASLVGSHSRSGSVVSVGNNAGHAPAKAIPRTATAEALSPTSSLSPPLVAESVVQTKDVTSEPVGTAVPDTVDGIPISPSKSCYPPDAINDLVANARRERKVQDLEITNASLEAINRTLERQLRKQTSELRRYRRLSRSGRLSLPLALSRRDVSGGSASQSGATDMGSILEEEDAEDDDDRLDEDDLEPYDSGDDSSDYGSTSAGSSNLSPTNSTSAASRALRIRRRDEKRLQLDLSRHQQLLVDSQKMNQSLKRCIDWTEELIREGRRALAYYVPVSDVQLGGRVLAAPDEDDEDDEADEAGGPDEGGDEDHHYLEQEQEQHNADLQPSSPLREGEKEEWSDPNEVKDRDSGIELAEA